ncbi:MAG: ABC transporter substrate-binding protein [Lacisediminihabitans sp.]
MVDTTFKDYAAKFEKKYPGTHVKFEAVANYEADVTTRLSSGNYGDVLLIPNTVSQAQLPQFFVPFGTVADLKSKYRFLQEEAYKGNAYGIATFGTVTGVVYNKAVWSSAGITSNPTSPDQFLADLKLIKEKTSAIPYYTNYAAGWPLGTWGNTRGMAGNADASNLLVQTNSPWAAGQTNYVADGLLYDIVHDGLSEPDPTTTNWESSKGLIGSGKVGSMVLGSWAIAQMQDAAVKAGKPASDIGFMPFPYSVNGKQYATLQGDYKMGISIHSANKATARAWVDWFTKDSGYSETVGGISPLVGSANPANLKSFSDAGVAFIELNPAPAGKENLEATISKTSGIDIKGNLYLQKLVDIARGAASGDKASYFAQLNQQWAAAKAKVAG